MAAAITIDWPKTNKPITTHGLVAQGSVAGNNGLVTAVLIGPQGEVIWGTPRPAKLPKWKFHFHEFTTGKWHLQVTWTRLLPFPQVKVKVVCFKKKHIFGADPIEILDPFEGQDNVCWPQFECTGWAPPTTNSVDVTTSPANWQHNPRNPIPVDNVTQEWRTVFNYATGATPQQITADDQPNGLSTTRNLTTDQTQCPNINRSRRKKRARR